MISNVLNNYCIPLFITVGNYKRSLRSNQFNSELWNPEENRHYAENFNGNKQNRNHLSNDINNNNNINNDDDIDDKNNVKTSEQQQFDLLEQQRKLHKEAQISEQLLSLLTMEPKEQTENNNNSVSSGSSSVTTIQRSQFFHFWPSENLSNDDIEKSLEILLNYYVLLSALRHKWCEKLIQTDDEKLFEILVKLLSLCDTLPLFNSVCNIIGNFICDSNKNRLLFIEGNHLRFAKLQ
jgi:hypothetical protein